MTDKAPVATATSPTTAEVQAKQDFTEFSQSGITNRLLAEQSAVIRARTITWDANMITQEEMDRILKFDKQRVNFEKDGVFFLQTLLQLLSKIVRVDTVQYLLVLFDDAIQAAYHFPAVLDVLSKQKNDAYIVFGRFLQKDDEFTQLKAAKVTVELYCAFKTIQEDQFHALMRWCFAQIEQAKGNQLDLSLQCVQVLMRFPHLRQLFYNNPTYLKMIVDCLKKNLNPQVNYQLVLILWLLSFIPDCCRDYVRKFDLVPLFLEISKGALKEKLIRVCFATMKNMLTLTYDTACLPFVGNKVLNLVELFITRKWTDEDIKEDLVWLRDELNLAIQKLSSWDEYASELRSGKLEWSPPHTSELFWKQNASKLNDKDYELLRTLSRLLVTSSNATVLAVACYDFGMYVKHCPQGKKIVMELGAKQHIMELMTHDNPEVRYNALLATQQYMSNAWEY